MNERIKLPDQEWLGYDPEKGDIHGYTFEQMQEFAKLIVRECAQVSGDDITDGDACCTNTADRIARQIKQHFGVEQ